MKLMMKLGIVTAALVINYLTSWNYNNEQAHTLVEQDSILVSASNKYSRMNPLKWFFLGKNYREEWSIPVKMPVFHLHSTKGGFTIERIGGGQQTKSLHLVNKNGSGWVLRSVDKNVRDALPEKWQGTFVQSIVQDQISASYPYGILTIHDLAKAVNIPSYKTTLYYVPDDPALGKYRAMFARSVMFLSSKEINGEDIETESTDSIRTLVDSSSYYQLLQQKILTVRLFDMLIADWDRHKGQWDWAFQDSIHTMFIYPVPEDRDQAYFLSKGALTHLVKLFVPHLIGFKENPKKLKKLNNKAHDFDRYYLNELSRKDWERSIKDFQLKLTDDVIQKAVKRLPEEVYAISGEEIKQKLINRRNGLLKEGLRYYKFIAKEVNINATNEAEVFRVNSNSDSTTVTVWRAANKRKVFERTFYPDETKKININKMGKNDQLDVSGASEIDINYN